MTSGLASANVCQYAADASDQFPRLAIDHEPGTYRGWSLGKVRAVVYKPGQIGGPYPTKDFAAGGPQAFIMTNAAGGCTPWVYASDAVPVMVTILTSGDDECSVAEKVAAAIALK